MTVGDTISCCSRGRVGVGHALRLPLKWHRVGDEYGMHCDLLLGRDAVAVAGACGELVGIPSCRTCHEL